jgi:predicted dinucleotide-binding enzyme
MDVLDDLMDIVRSAVRNSIARPETSMRRQLPAGQARLGQESGRGGDMDITIIGTGNMARGIGTRALAGGHTVTLLGTERQKAEALAAELSGDVRAGTVGDPIADEVVVLAVWYQAVDDVLGRYDDRFAGRVLVDITNPVDPQTFAPLTVEAGSAAQEIARKAPDARVVKAFNTTFAGSLVAGEVGGQPLDVFVASDDDAAKAAVRELAESSGLRVIDAGPLAHARQLEGAGYLHMAVQPAFGGTYASALKIVS